MPFADLVLKDANVITVDPNRPSDRLVAVKGDRIWLVGDKENLDEVSGAGTKVIDCQGRTLVPGFIDAHCHIFSLLRKQLSVDLSPPKVRSISDIKTLIRIKAETTPPGEWISATDYNDFYLAEKRHPTRWDIDDVAPDHPVVLSHRSLHACVLNSKGMALAGITRETPEPPGCVIERDVDTGEPNGLLFEMLGYIRHHVMPPMSEAELARSIDLANQHYLCRGITSLQDATITNEPSRWQIYRRFKEAGRLNSRIYLMTGMDELPHFQEAGLTFGSGDDDLRLGGIKIVLGETTGRLFPAQEELEQQIIEAQQAGFQVAIHAIQPNVVEAAIVALEKARQMRTDRRHRIEHCAVCPPPLLERLKSLQAIIVTQPPFIRYSGERYLAMVPPDQLPYLYRMRSFLDAGLIVAAGSDAPIVPDDPLIGISAAVTRQTESGQFVLPEEAVSVSRALAMYTTNAAYAAFEERTKGSITPGKLADLVLLSDDPNRVPPDEIRNVKVEMTIIGGRVVWEG